MTAHELAKRLLNGPDTPIEVAVANSKDTAYSRDIGVRAAGGNAGIPTYVQISGWVDSDDEEAYAPWSS